MHQPAGFERVGGVLEIGARLPIVVVGVALVVDGKL
jgi:hypothetical protein